MPKVVLSNSSDSDSQPLKTGETFPCRSDPFGNLFGPHGVELSETNPALRIMFKYIPEKNTLVSREDNDFRLSMTKLPCNRSSFRKDELTIFQGLMMQQAQTTPLPLSQWPIPQSLVQGQFMVKIHRWVLHYLNAN